MRRKNLSKSILLYSVVMALAICSARAQDVDEPNPGGGSFEVVSAEGLAAQFGAQYGTLAASGLQNNFGGYYLSFQNPTGPGGSDAGQTGDSIMGDNYGGEYFAEGSEVDNENTPAVYISGPDGNTYEVSSYLGPYFISPPSANDTVLFHPQATPATSPPIPIGDETQFGVGNGALEIGYSYQGFVVTNPPSPTYTISLSGTIAELIGTSGYNPAATAGINFENPVVQLDGAFTATNDAILSGLDPANPLVIQGSGSLITANALLAGSINITSGTVTATNQLIVGNDIPSYFGTNFYTGTSEEEADNLFPGTPNTTVTFSGSSSVLNASNYIVVGVATGTSTLQLMNGAQANTGDIYLADETGATGDLVVNGSTLTSTGFMDVGEGANTTANVTISNGGKVSDTDGAIGFGNNAQASVTVTGSGSTWNNSGYVAVGYSSTNVDDTLTVSNGGAVNSVQFLAIGGEPQAGTSGMGSVYIMSGGDVTSGTGVTAQTLAAAVGFGTNSTGSVLIDGSGSSWDVKQRLDVGYSSGSTGTITVQNGGTLQVEGDILRLGNVKGSTGSLTFDGTGGSPTFTFTTANSNFYIGDEGTGNFTVQGGAQITESAAVVIGNESTATGTATVQGSNSSWTIDNSLMVGENGTGTLSILNGDTVTVQQGENVILGDQAGSKGTLTLNGAGSGLSVTQATAGGARGDALEIGNHGVGKLQVQNGATITFNNLTSLGEQTDGQGQVLVDGTGSTATFNNSLYVGDSATGSGSNAGGLLSITGGGQVTVGGSGFVIGNEEGSTGEVDVTGAGSILNVSSGITEIGEDGTGTLNVTNGGQFNALDNIVVVGNGTGPSFTTSTVTVTGAGSQFTTGNLYVGDKGYGLLNASQGAQLTTNGDVQIASTTSGIGLSLGTVTLDTKSIWNVTGNVSVGGDGTGNLTVQGASTLTTTDLDIGSGDTTGTATVTGTGSTLTATAINVGTFLGVDGNLSIKNGGQVSTQSFDFGQASGNGALTVDGAGSTLTTGTFGFGGADNVTVSNGGVVTVNGSSLDDQSSANGNGMINVTGSGSKFDATAAATLLVTVSNINILDGGTLDTGTTSIGQAAIQLSSTGSASNWNVGGQLTLISDSVTLSNNSSLIFLKGAQVESGSVSLDGSGASLTGPSLQVGKGGLLSVSNSAQASLVNTLSITSGGTVDVTGGGYVQVGTSAKVAAGAVNIGGSNQVSNGGLIKGDVNINAGGSLVGAGSVTGTVNGPANGAAGGTVNGNVTNAGTVAPNDPQTMTIDGNYTQMATGNLVLVLDGADSVDYDHLVVTGELSIAPGATIDLNFGNGFAPTVGQTFDLVQYGSLDLLNSDFTNVHITGLEAGFEYTFTPVGTGGTNFQLTALNNGIATTTPEPATWALILAGMFLLAFLEKRKRSRETCGDQLKSSHDGSLQFGR